MRLTFVRHGESQANLLREFSNRGRKHGLTDRGREQARTLARVLTETPVAKIYSSPLLRAVQTAEILAEALGTPYAVADALREYDCGVLEGKSDAASWAIYDAVLNEWLRHGRWESRIEGGENFLDIRERFIPFIEELIRDHRESQDAIVLVGHGGTTRCMLPLVLANVDFAFVLEQPIPHTQPIVAELRPEGLVGLVWGETVL